MLWYLFDTWWTNSCSIFVPCVITKYCLTRDFTVKWFVVPVGSLFMCLCSEQRVMHRSAIPLLYHSHELTVSSSPSCWGARLLNTGSVSENLLNDLKTITCVLKLDISCFQMCMVIFAPVSPCFSISLFNSSHQVVFTVAVEQFDFSDARFCALS